MIKNPCKYCHGSKRIRVEENVTVLIPAGINNKDILRVSKYGDAGINNGSNGDLLVQVSVMADKIFKRNGDNLESSIKVSYPYLVFGCEITINSIDDSVETIKIPAGFQIGEFITIKNKGFNRLNGAKGRGDFIITIACDVPTKISKEAKDILKKYSDEISENTKSNKNENGFLSGFFKNLF